MLPYNFAQRGGWDPIENVGNAQLAPAVFHDIVIDRIQALWQSEQRGGRVITKNHMAWRLYFANSTDMTFKGTMLSMELDDTADENDTFPSISPIPRCGMDYCPGTFTLKMLPYDSMTLSAVFWRDYTTAPGCTLGQFIRSVLERHMEQFLFHIYTSIDAFKGCGHFCVVAYLAWVSDGLILDPKSIDYPHRTFPEDVVFTYLPGGRYAEALVGRGQFLNLVRLSTEEDYLDEPHPLAPSQIYAQGNPRYNRVLAGQDVDVENDIAFAAEFALEDNLV